MPAARALPNPNAYRRANYFWRLWFRFRSLPAWLRWGGLVSFVVGACVVAYLAQYQMERWAREKRRIQSWKEYEEYAAKGNLDEMRPALAKIVQAHPNDALARKRAAQLESLSADDDDGETALVLFQVHQRAGRWPEAEREARKVLAKYPDHWPTRLACVRAALIRNDVDAAKKELDQLPDPNGIKNVAADPGHLMLAFHLYAALGKDPAPLRRFAAERVVARLRSPDTRKWPHDAKLLLLECYVRAFSPDGSVRQQPELVSAVSDLGTTVEATLQQALAARDAGALERLSAVVQAIPPSLALLRKEGQLADEQLEAARAEANDRGDRIARGLVEVDPKSPAGWRALVLGDLRRNELAKAGVDLGEGLTQTGNHPELAAIYAQLLRSGQRGREAVRVLKDAAEARPKEFGPWLQLGETAGAVGDPGTLEEALAKCRELAPADPRTLLLAVSGHLLRERYADALLELDKLPEAARVADPRLARWTGVAMERSGFGSRVPEFLRKVEAQALAAKSPDAAAAAFRAVTETPRYDKDAVDTVIALAPPLVDRWPEAMNLLAAQAMANYARAERAAPRWDPPAVRTAIATLRNAAAKQPDNPDIAAAVAWVRLKGEKNPAQAVLDARPLAEALRNNAPLTPWHLQVLGSCYAATGRHREALAALEKAIQLGGDGAGIRIPLAVAYHGLDRMNEAKAVMQELQESLKPKTDQETDDYLAAIKLILKP